MNSGNRFDDTAEVMSRFERLLERLLAEELAEEPEEEEALLLERLLAEELAEEPEEEARREEAFRERLREEEEFLRTRIIISKDTPISGIVDALTELGCPDLTQSFDTELQFSQAIARGGFSDIHQAVTRSGSLVAIKTLRVTVTSDDEPDRIPKRAAREIHNWSQCHHTNVLPLLGLAVFQNQIRMVSSWMDNGNLPAYLKEHPDLDRYHMCSQICDGLEYIHNVPMVHGDLKGVNVLVSDEGVPMITDFGNAVFQYGELQFTQTTKTSGFTVRWTAPEILTDEVTQSQESDVYALGMTILEIMTGDVPYPEQRNEMKLIFAIGGKNLKPTRSIDHIPCHPRGDAVWSLLMKCWNSVPEERPSASEVAQEMKLIAKEPLDLNSYGSSGM